MSRLLRLTVLFSIPILLLAGNSSIAQTADFTGTPLSGCAPLVVDFTDASTGTITSYSWNLGNSTTSTLQNPQATYSNPGSYNVTLTVTGPGGTDVETKNAYIIVYDKPAVSFVATTAASGCTPHAVQFSSTVTANSPGTPTYSWDFGDGSTGSGANPSHTYTFPGTYPVSLTVTNGAGCIQTFTRNSYITAHTVPVPGFNATQTSFCSVPAVANFTNTTVNGTTPYTTSWTFGDGGTGTGSTPSHTYTTGGGFTVTMIVTDANGCTKTLSAPGYISVNTTAPTFTAPSSICVAAEGTYVNTTTGTNTANWDFDDGFTGSGNTVTHTYASAGTYTVRMTVNIGGCVKTSTKTVTVHPKPVPAIAITPLIPCPATETLTFVGSSTVAAAATYTWSWLSGGTATGQTVTKIYTSNIIDEVKLIVTSANGCIDSAFAYDTIRNILVHISPGGLCDIDPYGTCVNDSISFSVDLFSSLPAPIAPCAYEHYPLLPAVTTLWDFGDLSPTSTLATPNHAYTTVGDYTVTCTITTANGCTAIGTRKIHADVPVTPSFTTSPLTTCPKEMITLFNTTTSPLPNTTYTWQVFDIVNGIDDTVMSSTTVLDMRPAIKRPGTYSVRLKTNHLGCIDSAARYNYIVVHPPGASFTSFVRCSPSRIVDFANTSSNSTSQFWDFGDGNTSTAHSPSHTYAATGTYKVRFTAYNSTFNCLDRDSAFVTVFDPNLDFTVLDKSICTGDFGKFTALFGGSGAVSYTWIFNGPSGVIQTPYVDSNTMNQQFTVSGIYDVTLVTRSGNNCYDTIKKLREVIASRPVVAFDATPPIGCAPLQVVFTDHSTNTPPVRDTSFTWTFGDGGTIQTASTTVNHTYNVPGTYTVKLVVVDTLKCVDSLVRNNYVGVYKPIAAFTASDTAVCALEPVLFNSTSSGTALPLQYSWNFGDGRTDNVPNPTHRYTAVGQYTVTLTVTDTVGCTDVYVLPQLIKVDAPHAEFTMSDSQSICPSIVISFSSAASQRAVSYSWDFGSGTQIPTPNPSRTFSGAGIYPVYLVVTDVNGCTDTARDTIRILGYSGAFSYTPINGCAPLTVNFTTPIIGIPQIRWDFGDGTVTPASAATTTSHTYLTPNPYLPKIIFSDGALCTTSSDGLDTIWVDQLNPDFDWTVPCVGTAFTLTQNSTARYNQPDQWTWYFSGGTDTAVGVTASYTYHSSGIHPVSLVVGNIHGCRDTITKDVFINPLPLINATNDTGVCPGDKVTLMVTGGISYNWSPAPDSLGNLPTSDIAYVHLDSLNPGAFRIFTVTGTDINGCVNKDSTKVYIQLKTTSSVGTGGEICVGESFRLHAEGAHKYTWFPPETIDSPFIASPLATPERTTTYIVAAQEGTCAVDSQHVHVVVHSRPIFSAGNDEIIALGSAVTLKPTRSGITRIEWAPDTTLSCLHCFDPAARPYYTRTYYATGYNEFGCSASDSVTVHVRCNGSLVFIPNTFTPNADGLNDYFFPRGEGIDRMNIFRVYNRWGEVVFERSNVALNDERGGWDGTFKGKALPPDVYVYTMQSSCSSGEILKWKGDITLIK